MPDELMPSTVTHARLRAAQGDFAGAREVLRTVLDRSPDDAAALRLMAELTGRRDSARQTTTSEVEGPRVEASAATLSSRFTEALNPAAARRRARQRLQALLDRIEGSSPAAD